MDLFQDHTVSEWGIPFKNEGRHIFLAPLRRATQAGQLCLWVNGHVALKPFAATFFAHGVQARHMLFANSQDPMRELKQALLSDLFRLMILDCGPRQIHKHDMAFLRQQSMAQQRHTCVIRPYLLSNDRGNVWAKVRANVTCDARHRTLRLHAIRGRAHTGNITKEMHLP